MSTLADLKELVAYAESAGLKSVKLGDLEIAFSDYQLAKRVISEVEAQATIANAIVKSNPANAEEQQLPESGPPKHPIYDDPDLFASSN